MLASIVFFCINLTRGATIAELIASDPALSRVAAQASRHPSWSQSGQISVFAPTDNAISRATHLPSGDVGVITSRVSVGPETVYYYVEDEGGVTKLTFQNNMPGSSSAITLRTGQGTGTVSRATRADNGWLYVTDNIAFGPPQNITSTLKTLGCTRFFGLIEQTGLANFVDGLKDVTL